MISAVVHTYNEQKNIRRALSSLFFADEIVLIDMGSTDNTKEIAEGFKAKIYHHAFTGFVEAARNFGISRAKGDWIFILDADEEVPRALAAKIRALVSKKVSPVNFFRIPRKNIIFTKWVRHSGWWPDYQIRLFKKGMVSWSDKIHGIPITVGAGQDLEISEGLSIIHHHYDSVGQYLDRLNRYTSIQSRQRFLKNKKAGFKELLLSPLQEFVKRFFKEEGYKDGWHGLSLAALQSFSEFIVILKLWELNGFKDISVKLPELRQLVVKANRIINYWFANEMLKFKNNPVSSLFLRIMRKINS